jgi:hypothetical protein
VGRAFGAASLIVTAFLVLPALDGAQVDAGDLAGFLAARARGNRFSDQL